MSRLYGARLNFSPNNRDEVKVNMATWMEALWANPPSRWNTGHAPQILKVFGRLAIGCDRWPTPSEFYTEWRMAQEEARRAAGDLPQLSEPELTDAQKARVRVIRNEIAAMFGKPGDKAANDKRMLFTGEVFRGIADQVREEESECQP